MSEGNKNPAWVLTRALEGDDGVAVRALIEWLWDVERWRQDVDRRLPPRRSAPARPTPREVPGEAMAAAVERAGEAPGAQAERPIDEADDRKHGLYGKYTVRRTDRSSEPGGKHEHCRYFVLDLDHDKFAAPALRTYAQACGAEYPALAEDLLRMVGAACAAADPDPQLCAKCQGGLKRNGQWRECVACAKSWRVPTRVRPEARPQSAWVVEEPSAEDALDLGDERERQIFHLRTANHGLLLAAEKRDEEIRNLRESLDLLHADHRSEPAQRVVTALRRLLVQAIEEEADCTRNRIDVVMASRALLRAIRDGSAYHVGFSPGEVLP